MATTNLTSAELPAADVSLDGKNDRTRDGFQIAAGFMRAGFSARQASAPEEGNRGQ
jgi:hypothetical protein